MTRHGSAHPLDLDLADLVDGVADQDRAAELEAHLAACLLCRIKRQRLRAAPPARPPTDGEWPSLPVGVPRLVEGGDPNPGEIWLAGTDTRILVLIVRAHRERLLVAPVTLDVDAADDETVVVDARHSPLGTQIAVHAALAVEVARAVLAGRVAAFPTDAALGGALTGEGPGVRRGAAIDGASDPRLELRQHLADRLALLEEMPPDPASRADAPALGGEDFRSALIGDLRSLRGASCAVRAINDWGGGLLSAHRNGWKPMVVIDEVGIVLVVLDTPHGLVDDRDFDAARAVLTRFNATALVLLSRGLSDLAEIFDSSSLNHGIDIPSGAHTPPRPLIGGLTPFDAITKYLDQHTGARSMGPSPRVPLTRVDVGEILRESAAAAVTETVRQGARFKIAPKRRGYESLADAHDALSVALGQAFTDASVIEDLLNLARRNQG